MSKSCLLFSLSAWTEKFMSSRSFLAWVCTGVRMELVWVSSQRFTSSDDENWRVASVNAVYLLSLFVGLFINFSPIKSLFFG
jgi:hypothetical protein